MRCFAYVDGSYSQCTDKDGKRVGIYGSGIYLSLEGYAQPMEISLGDNDPDLVGMHNIAGELKAVCYLMKVLETELPEYKHLDLYFDYEGIEKWVTGEWKANKPVTKAYRNLMREYVKTYRIVFHNVMAHSGVRYNERADRLAKRGVRLRAEKLGLTM